MIIKTGNTGVPLKDIIKQLGNKNYAYIECRCKWDENGKKYDEFWESCSYDNKTETLTSLDGDSYSLEDLYFEWKEWMDTKNDNNAYLTIWEKGEAEQTNNKE